LADALDGPPAFTDVTGTVPNPQAAESAGLVSEALKQRPERQALTFRIEGAQARERAAATGQKPTIALSGGFDFANPNPKIFPREEKWQSSWDLGVNVSWTLFDGGRTRAEVAEAAALARAAEERLKDLDTLVGADVRQRLLDLKSSLASVRASEDGVRAATEARRVLGERFAVGVATTTDVLIAQDQLLTAELARARALASVRLAKPGSSAPRASLTPCLPSTSRASRAAWRLRRRGSPVVLGEPGEIFDSSAPMARQPPPSGCSAACSRPPPAPPSSGWMWARIPKP
jgi:outer membrane protein TolC